MVDVTGELHELKMSDQVTLTDAYFAVSGADLSTADIAGSFLFTVLGSNLLNMTMSHHNDTWNVLGWVKLFPDAAQSFEFECSIEGFYSKTVRWVPDNFRNRSTGIL